VSGPAAQPSQCLDLRGTPCPLNFIRSKLALEKLDPGQWLQVDLDAGEPERLVAAGLREAGHRVELESLAATADGDAVRLLIRRGG
jgi:TusA-related sulfurtransferase